jgi:ubiquinone biosynthesis protein Coq4
MSSNIKINYQNTNLREYYLLKFLEWITPLHTKLIGAKRKAWQLSTADLLMYPAESLGFTLGQFLQANHLEPVPKAEKHDCYHVLLNYKTDMLSETQMQWFLVGSGKRTLFTTGAAILALLVLPERFNHYKSAYQRGKKAVNISGWDFYSLLKTPLSQLQHIIFHKN